MAQASTQQEDKMANKKIGRYHFSWGTVDGFAVGICICKYFITIDLGFFYVGIEF